MNARSRRLLAAGLVALAGVGPAAAQPVSSAVTYQGELRAAGAAVAGPVDLRFNLFTAASGGSQVGPTIDIPGAVLTLGRFTQALDFGAGSFGANARYLEIQVRNPAGTGSYVTLSPRQVMTAAPVAQFALSGNPGPTGAQGATGPQGSAGAQGAPGVTGPQGAAGAQGGAGAQGSSGPQGVMGPQGATGATGSGFALPFSGSTAASIGVDVSTSNSASSSAAVRGLESSATGVNYGVLGQASSTTGVGVQGRATATTGINYGMYGQSSSTAGIGVCGQSLATSGTNYGVYGVATSPAGKGVYGYSPASTGSAFGVHGRADSASGVAIYGEATSTAGATWGVYGQSVGPGGLGVFGRSYATSGSGIGVYGEGHSSDGYGVYASNPDATGTALRAVGGLIGVSAGGFNGLEGVSQSTFGDGVLGECDVNGGDGVHGYCSDPGGYGVFSSGRFGSTGTKSFVIDHPLDPANKLLLHYSAEGPEPQNVYNGKVVLDSAGEGVVELPAYFASVNKEPRYQLTAVGAAMPMLHVETEISEEALNAGGTCSFRIGGGAPGGKVSWEVKGVRNDLWVRTNGAPVEVEKAAPMRGAYEQPELYGLPREMGMKARAREVHKAGGAR